MAQEIDLRTPLSLRSSFRFPVQSRDARREVLIGALLLVVLPGVGWVLNQGHRIMMVHKMLHGQSPWPSWTQYGALLRHGAIALLGVTYYYVPALACAALALWLGSPGLWGIALLLALLAIVAIPGFMTHYSRSFDAREIFNPSVALSRCAQGGRAYWHAWGIVSTAFVVSVLGVMGLGVGFLVSTIWFWQVAGFAFATVFASRFALRSADNPALVPQAPDGDPPVVSDGDTVRSS